MKRTAFSRWLDRQRNRRDPVGDLARDAHGDTATYLLVDFGSWETFLFSVRASDGAVEAARRAWKEFKEAEIEKTNSGR